jgi:hypothetical protein
MIEIEGPREFFVPTEPRYKVLKVAPELLLDCLLSPRMVPGGMLYWLETSGIPEGCRIQAVVYDFYRDCFCFKLYHPDFPPVNPGEVLPELEVTVRRLTLDLDAASRRRGVGGVGL